MKKITRELFDKIFEETIIEYTKTRFMAEDEFEEIKSIFIEATDNRILSERFCESGVEILLSDI